MKHEISKKDLRRKTFDDGAKALELVNGKPLDSFLKGDLECLQFVTGEKD